MCLSDPNGEINEALEEILIIDDNQQLIKNLKLPTSKTKNLQPMRKSQGMNWGWLREKVTERGSAPQSKGGSPTYIINYC
ncbi:hypothetical protein H6F74_03470 [Trichocoleus sp. FACHB-90]|uniref:hypothetical protein n=1 Tax=Cyanophyceae TaxID=3028117 RepID=UPI001687B7A8|nr:hypothetical protein [Trichocoleus sp. FACHB-90]MBD1925348.1 hypothetical protein [Trichocoleus sp. FACHB-90]